MYAGDKFRVKSENLKIIAIFLLIISCVGLFPNITSGKSYELKITDLRLEPTQPYVGEEVKIYLSARNVGAKSLDGFEYSYAYPPGMPIMGSTKIKLAPDAEKEFLLTTYPVDFREDWGCGDDVKMYAYVYPNPVNYSNYDRTTTCILVNQVDGEAIVKFRGDVTSSNPVSEVKISKVLADVTDSLNQGDKVSIQDFSGSPAKYKDRVEVKGVYQDGLVKVGQNPRTYIKILEPLKPPVAKFFYTPSDPVVDEQVTFDASDSYDPDGSIASYKWDWDDDRNYEANGKSLTHSFDKSGTYNVCLKVFDNDNLSDKKCKEIDVKPNQPDLKVTDIWVPGAFANSGENIGVIKGKEVTFSCTVKDVGNARTGPFSLKLIIGGKEYDLTESKSLEPGNSRDISFPREWTAKGSPYIKVKADWDNSVAEINEDNNRRVEHLETMARDIEVKEVNLSPNPAMLGERATLTVDLKSVGPVEAPAAKYQFNLEFYDLQEDGTEKLLDKKELSSKVGRLLSLQKTSVGLEFNLSTDDESFLSLADADKIVVIAKSSEFDEKSYENNEYSKEIEVLPERLKMSPLASGKLEGTRKVKVKEGKSKEFTFKIEKNIGHITLQLLSTWVGEVRYKITNPKGEVVADSLSGSFTVVSHEHETDELYRMAIHTFDSPPAGVWKVRVTGKRSPDIRPPNSDFTVRATPKPDPNQGEIAVEPVEAKVVPSHTGAGNPAPWNWSGVMKIFGTPKKTYSVGETINLRIAIISDYPDQEPKSFLTRLGLWIKDKKGNIIKDHSRIYQAKAENLEKITKDLEEVLAKKVFEEIFTIPPGNALLFKLMEYVGEKMRTPEGAFKEGENVEVYEVTGEDLLFGHLDNPYLQVTEAVVLDTEIEFTAPGLNYVGLNGILKPVTDDYRTSTKTQASVSLGFFVAEESKEISESSSTTVDLKEAADTEVSFHNLNSGDSGSIHAFKYDDPPLTNKTIENSTRYEPFKYLDIKVTGLENGYATTKIHYTNDELPWGVVNGNDLKLYYWREPNNSWIKMSSSTVNPEKNIVRGEIPVGHLSGTPIALTGNIVIKKKWNISSAGMSSSFPAINCDGTIFFFTSKSSKNKSILKAINPDGTKKWSKTVKGLSSFSSPAISPDGDIYIVASPYLYAFTRNGTKQWKLNTGTRLIGTPAIGSDGVVYVNGRKENLYAIDPGGKIKWNFDHGGGRSSSPVIGTKGNIYVYSGHESMLSISKKGELRWEKDIKGSTSMSPAITKDGTILIGDIEGNFYAIKPNGELKWKYSLDKDSEFIDPLLIRDSGTILVSTFKNTFAFSPTGEKKWKSQVGTPFSIGADGVIYTISSSGYLYAISSRGKIKWKKKLEGQITLPRSGILNKKGILFVATWRTMEEVKSQLTAISSPSNGSTTTQWGTFHNDSTNSGNVNVESNYTHPIPYAVSHWVDGELNPGADSTISTDQILQAIAWWADDTQVPQTGGETISTDMILELISYWAEGKEITEPTTTTPKKEAKTQSTTTTPLKDLSQKLFTETLPATKPLTVNLSFSPERKIAVLVLDLKLPNGWSLVEDEDGQPAYKPSTDQLLWLDLQKGEPVQLTYKLLPPSDIDAPTKYEIKGKLISKSPILNRQLPTKTLTLAPPPELTLQEATVSPNPITADQNLTFRAEGEGIASTKLQVFDTSGRKLYQTGYHEGSTITWDLTDSEGNELINGIYLYRIKAKGADGTVQMSKVQRLLVLR